MALGETVFIINSLDARIVGDVTPRSPSDVARHVATSDLESQTELAGLESNCEQIGSIRIPESTQFENNWV